MSPAFPLLLVVGSGVVYHLSQKAAGPSASPWPLLSLAYGFALVACLGLGWATGGGAAMRRLPDRGTMLLGLTLGLAVLGVELGFFLAYRSGWALGSASVICNIGVTAALAVIGVAALGEAFTLVRGAGIALAAAAGWMIVRG
jgi:hypothetical protein